MVDRDRVFIPLADRAAVWIDFDGTITRKDVLDELIRTFAVDEFWRDAEDRWQRGVIGSRQCLSEQFACVRVGPDQLEPFLDRIPLDPGLGQLIDVIDRAGVPVTVVSDGIDVFIARLLNSVQLSRLTVRSNTIERSEERLTLVCPHGRADCQSASAHCKCSSIDALAGGRTGSIYIGDGRSDLCPSLRCETVFAKGTLARLLGDAGKPFITYDSLTEVADRLEAAWDPK